MEKSVKVFLVISLILLVIYATVLFNDYNQFHNNLTQILRNLESAEPAKIQAAWFSVVVMRSVEFLIPALLLGSVGLIIHIRDHQVPGSRNRFRLSVRKGTK